MRRVTALLALAGALIVGASDFVGGLTSRDNPTYRVVAWIQASSLAMTALAVLPIGWVAVSQRDVVAAIVAGLSSSFSFIALYRAFTLGSISVLAPTAAVLSAIIPTVVGWWRGESLSALNVAGLAIGLVAITLVAQDRSARSGKAAKPSEAGAEPQANAKTGKPPTFTIGAFGLAALAGVGFSIFFLALAETSPDAGLWPLVVARLVSVPVVFALAVGFTGTLAVTAGSPRLLLLGGFGEATANLFAMMAYQRGPLAVAAVLSALFPISTVLLARLVLAERLQTIQWAGVGLAMVAIPLVVWP